jgi:hypothetical protein
MAGDCAPSLINGRRQIATDAANYASMFPTHLYEIRARADKRGVDLVSDALPFGRLWVEVREILGSKRTREITLK